MATPKNIIEAQNVKISLPTGGCLEAVIELPLDSHAVVLFAHGSGSTHHSPRQRLVARFLWEGGIGTVSLDLLTLEEQEQDQRTHALRFNIPLLAERLLIATRWAFEFPLLKHCTIGYFGASTGAAAALRAAAELGPQIGAIVSRGGRPDLAGQALGRVRAPTLLLVGSEDYGIIELNEIAWQNLQCEKRFEKIPTATHLFEEPGTLEEVGRMATLWFQSHL